ncbi:MAG: conjugal transfer protein [Erysipelotrichaceae bacterium]|nr:conjugal transfer protein [Erysipelotrichaceae bacterium]
MDKNEKLIRYSMQLAYLATLLSAKLITENEYSLIKKKLQKDYKVPSDILADFESREVR